MIAFYYYSDRNNVVIACGDQSLISYLRGSNTGVRDNQLACVPLRHGWNVSSATDTHFGENKRLHPGLESSTQNYYIISLWTIIKGIFTQTSLHTYEWKQGGGGKKKLFTHMHKKCSADGGKYNGQTDRQNLKSCDTSRKNNKDYTDYESI